jgi:hypothetical protein
MWYFTVKKEDLEAGPYKHLQKLASSTEVELFSEPYYNFCIFEVDKDRYRDCMDYLDREGITYELNPVKPTRDDLLAGMR